MFQNLDDILQEKSNCSMDFAASWHGVAKGKYLSHIDDVFHL